ncbi:CBM_HP2_G0009890.mRNA.1.CDS.1 [Saccharomyces cerevisiae]|nr:CBM_HP2_G0009890.mRNA.1.CDS.1 [Saccharomyces cerevisiae]CAI6420620.1 CBM_HP2_G0009890.mRNA.1.CDS.1 [Saccharomyces cerevisiae]
MSLDRTVLTFGERITCCCFQQGQQSFVLESQFSKEDCYQTSLPELVEVPSSRQSISDPRR